MFFTQKLRLSPLIEIEEDTPLDRASAIFRFIL
jgi:hypothetical protein